MDDEELYYCETTSNEQKWFLAQDVPESIRDEYMNKVRSPVNECVCNTHKINTTSCDVKVKTREILSILSNCGVIVGYREIYGSESITQVANLYLNIADLFQSKILQPLAFKYFNVLNFIFIKCSSRANARIFGLC